MKRISLLVIWLLILGFFCPSQAFSQEVGTPISAVPCTIYDPGYYYFTDNLTAATNHGIFVRADHVTIDLKGFTLNGPGQVGNTYSGIYFYECSNAEVRNGTIRNFKGSGISQTGGDSSNNCRIINVRLADNGYSGIYLEGNSHLVKNCMAANNGSYGIYCRKGATLTGNIAYENGRDGIYGVYGCTVTGNTAYSNNWSGIHCYIGGTVADNTAYSNQRYGITLSSNALVDRNTAYNNDQSGGGYANIRSCSTCTFGLNHAP